MVDEAVPAGGTKAAMTVLIQPEESQQPDRGPIDRPKGDT